MISTDPMKLPLSEHSYSKKQPPCSTQDVKTAAHQAGPKQAKSSGFKGKCAGISSKHSGGGWQVVVFCVVILLLASMMGVSAVEEVESRLFKRTPLPAQSMSMKERLGKGALPLSSSSPAPAAGSIASQGQKKTQPLAAIDTPPSIKSTHSLKGSRGEGAGSYDDFATTKDTEAYSRNRQRQVKLQGKHSQHRKLLPSSEEGTVLDRSYHASVPNSPTIAPSQYAPHYGVHSSSHASALPLPPVPIQQLPPGQPQLRYTGPDPLVEIGEVAGGIGSLYLAGYVGAKAYKAVKSYKAPKNSAAVTDVGWRQDLDTESHRRGSTSNASGPASRSRVVAQTEGGTTSILPLMKKRSIPNPVNIMPVLQDDGYEIAGTEQDGHHVHKEKMADNHRKV